MGVDGRALVGQEQGPHAQPSAARNHHGCESASPDAVGNRSRDGYACPPLLAQKTCAAARGGMLAARGASCDASRTLPGRRHGRQPGNHDCPTDTFIVPVPSRSRARNDSATPEPRRSRGDHLRDCPTTVMIAAVPKAFTSHQDDLYDCRKAPCFRISTALNGTNGGQPR